MSKEKQIEEMARDIESGLPDYEHNYRDCIDAAKEMLAKGYRKQEWISVEERLPESSCECLVATNIGGVYQVSYSHRYKAFNALDTDEAKYAMLTVTHWMPLPEPPKGE